MKLNMAIFHHISSACNSASVEAIYLNEILKFDVDCYLSTSCKV